MREIIIDNSFKRRYKKFVKNRPEINDKFLYILKKLELDVKSKTLFTHKLTGELKSFYACRITYDLRLVFNYDEINI